MDKPLEPSKYSSLYLLGILASLFIILRGRSKFNSKTPREEKVTRNSNGEANKQAGHANKPIAPVMAPEPELEPTEAHCQGTSKREDNWWDKTKPFVELAGIVLLALYTFYTIKMYWANKEAADAAQEAAKAARDSITLAKTSAHFDQRAWLAISYGKLHFMVGQPFVFPVEIVDTGKTPAKGIHGEMVTLFLNRTDRLALNYDRGTSLEIGTVLPNEPHHAPSLLIATKLAPGETVTALPMSKQMFDAIRSGEACVVVYGRLSYRSVFGTEHWIHFCGLNETPIMRFSQEECTEYNDVDNNEEK